MRQVFSCANRLGCPSPSISEKARLLAVQYPSRQGIALTCRMHSLFVFLFITQCLCVCLQGFPCRLDNCFATSSAVPEFQSFLFAVAPTVLCGAFCPHLRREVGAGPSFCTPRSPKITPPRSTELRLAAAGWLGGFGTPPLAGWLAGAPPENSQNTSCTIVPHLLTHGMGMGMGLQGWGGSATFQEHPYLILQVALPSEPPIKTQNTKHRITASNVCSTANVVVTDVNLKVHNGPQSEIYAIHIAIYIPRHLSKEHLRLQLLMPKLVGHGDATTQCNSNCVG